ncbi:hypothetical protein ABBQ32_006809 [Trebouxia sp. C0010 RCD-2024]
MDCKLVLQLFSCFQSLRHLPSAKQLVTVYAALCCPREGSASCSFPPTVSPLTQFLFDSATAVGGVPAYTSSAGNHSSGRAALQWCTCWFGDSKFGRPGKISRILSMARFASEAELKFFLGRLDADYSQFASALWQNGVRTAHQLANAREPILLSCGLPELYIDDIKARVDRTVSQEQADSSAWQQEANATDRTGHYVRQLLEPALTAVPLAADVPSLFQSALYCSGTLPFPVPDIFYESQKRQDDDMKYYLAPVSHSGAVAFSSTIHAVLRKSSTRGQLDQLVFDVMDLLDEYAQKLHLKRKRIEGEVSLTLSAKRPDLCVLVRSALLLKGEDKPEEGQLDQAVAELKQKMRRWSQSHHGQVGEMTH